MKNATPKNARPALSAAFGFLAPVVKLHDEIEGFRSAVAEIGKKKAALKMEQYGNMVIGIRVGKVQKGQGRKLKEVLVEQGLTKNVAKRLVENSMNALYSKRRIPELDKASTPAEVVKALKEIGITNENKLQKRVEAPKRELSLVEELVNALSNLETFEERQATWEEVRQALEVAELARLESLGEEQDEQDEQEEQQQEAA